MDKKILIVDDAMFMRSMIRRILKQNGYEDVAEARMGSRPLTCFAGSTLTWCCLTLPCPESRGLRCLRK